MDSVVQVETAQPNNSGIVRAPYESEVTHVCWQWWLMTQSQYHRREVGVVDLGEIE